MRKTSHGLLQELDWGDLRVFAAVAVKPTLSAAAVELGLSVATVGRRLDRLERATGLRLVERDATGVRLTAEGQVLAERVGGIAERVADFARVAAADGSEDEVGIVTMTMIETLATRVVGPSLGRFRQAHPRITVILRADRELVRLASGQADVALRLSRPREARVVARKIATIRLALYASEDYLRRRGRPRAPLEGLHGHDLVTYEPSFGSIPELSWMLSRCADGDPSVQAGSALAIEAAVTSGAGIGMLPCGMVRDELVRIAGPEGLPERELWLVVHEDLRAAAHVRAVADHVAAVCVEVFG